MWHDWISNNNKLRVYYDTKESLIKIRRYENKTFMGNNGMTISGKVDKIKTSGMVEDHLKSLGVEN